MYRLASGTCRCRLTLLPVGHAAQGRHYNQREYQEYANLFKEVWLDGHPEVQAAIARAGKDGTAAARVLEEEYWCAISIVGVSTGVCRGRAACAG